MNYIYDILLNFQKNYYDFFEWNPEDEVVHIRKIPLFRVSNQDYKIFKNEIVRFSNELTLKVYNRTEKFKKVNVTFLNYVFLVSNGKEAMGLKLAKNGVITHKSSLMLDEEIEIADMAIDLKIVPMDYTSVSKEELNPFQTRSEKENSKYIINELTSLYNHKDDEKLRFLYLECFDKEEEDINKIFLKLQREITSHNDNYSKIFDFFKITGLK